LECPGIYAMVILRWIFRKWDEGAWTSDLSQERDGWRTLVNVVTNLLVP